MANKDKNSTPAETPPGTEEQAGTTTPGTETPSAPEQQPEPAPVDEKKYQFKGDSHSIVTLNKREIHLVPEQEIALNFQEQSNPYINSLIAQELLVEVLPAK